MQTILTKHLFQLYLIVYLDLINHYNTPGQLFNLINLQNQFDLRLKEMNLKDSLWEDYL